MSVKLTDKLIELLGSKGVVTDAAALDRYLVDQRGYYRGAAPAVARPACVDEVAGVVRLARAHRVAVVPQGGNTGLCGGATPDDSGGQLVLSLERMNRIRSVDTLNHSLTAEAGVVLQKIQDAAAGQGLFFPLDLAAKGSCQIGGNLATNAGGTNVLRYGNARDLVLGLEVVLADGTIWNGLSTLRKDNTGYDLRQLFIGSEGTLGIITAAALKLFPAPSHRRTAMLAATGPEAVCRLLGTARELSGDAVESFEYISRPALACALAATGQPEPLEAPHDHYVLLELAGAAGGDFLDGVLETLMAQGMASGGILDGVLAQNERQREALWRLRESISEAQRGSVKNDVSVPVSRMPAFLAEAAARVADAAPGARPCPFGHVGDGNVHYNVLAPESEAADAFRLRCADALIDAISELAVSMGGSFSAEHGVGRLRREMMARHKSPEALALMRALKAALDPDGLLNPGKVI